MSALVQLRPRSLAHESRVSGWVRRGKTSLLQARRLAEWTARPKDWSRPALAPPEEEFPHLLYARAIPIARSDDAAHPLLETGKRENLKLAAPRFDGLLLEPGQILSFWRVLGRAETSTGYRHGMALSSGCIVPSVGGGLCLLTNALFEAAAHLGWAIHERWGHTLQAVPAHPGELWGLDATVFWPHVDLRVAPVDQAVRLGVRVEGAGLLLSVRAKEARKERCELSAINEASEPSAEGVIRTNQIRRQTFDLETGTHLHDEIIAENRRTMLTPQTQRRNCLTCRETTCSSRVLPSEHTR